MNFENLKTKRLILVCSILYIIGSLFPVLAIENKSATVILPSIPVDTFCIMSYGAVNSTTVNNTTAIQQTINACSAAGGGVVLIPAGTFLSGPLAMKSKINLCIASGSILRILPYGSGNGMVAGTYPNSGTINDYTDFIYGKNLNNIAITGSGTLDGNGTDWWTAYRASSAIARPCLIRFDGCTYVLVSGIKLLNAPNVHLTIGKSGSNATLENLTITAPSSAPNTDWIDVWSPNINISNCNIAVGDDNIAMDSGSQNITVKNCVFGTGHGCSVGSYAANVGNIVVDSCSFTNTTSGIRLKTARDRGGLEQYFTYSNITMSGVTTPFYLTSYYPKEPASPSADPAQAITATTPTWQHLMFKNITVTGSPSAGIIWGLPEQSISDVVFDNVSISATTGMKAYFVSGLVFKNGSNIAVSGGSAVTIYSTSVSGINLATGKADITGLNDMQNSLIKCYPNPLNDGILKIVAPSTIDLVVITSTSGISIKTLHYNSTELNLNLSELPKGIYIVDIKLTDRSFSHQRIII
jgi:polygalacturonase